MKILNEKVFIGTEFSHSDTESCNNSLTVNGLIERLEYLRDYEYAGNMIVCVYECRGYGGIPYYSAIETDDINIGYEDDEDGLLLKDLDY